MVAIELSVMPILQCSNAGFTITGYFEGTSPLVILSPTRIMRNIGVGSLAFINKDFVFSLLFEIRIPSYEEPEWGYEVGLEV